MWREAHLEGAALVLLCEVVQQLDIPRLQQELHPELVTAGKGGKYGQGLLLLGGQAGSRGCHQ